jgi:2-polyprenyl-6-methoxyphenol hydroxylase-like FAD-dependent oxidoreductase
MKGIDVLVLGGGPAGGAIALTLARAGRAVTLVERSRYEQPRVGETLAPSARLVLASLGLWERFERQGHAPSYAIRSAWGDARLYEQDFTFHPYGTGWHLDRQLFDGMIADAAEEAGATVYRGGHLEDNPREEDGGWRVSLRHQGVVRRFHASFVVDATGRAASFARRRGAVRKAHDALVGVLIFSSPCSPSRISRGFYTLVEATESGWWYSALLPDLRMVAIYLTDADLLPRGRQALPAFWQARLKQTDHTRARLRSFNVESCLRVVVANSSTLDRLSGSGWLAAGDAAMAFDPLSSQGISQALESGALAGQALERHFEEDSAALPEYAAQRNQVFGRYAQLYEGYYGREQRWPLSTFWQRRQDTSNRMRVDRAATSAIGQVAH